jgi:hypothetical protein
VLLQNNNKKGKSTNRWRNIDSSTASGERGAQWKRDQTEWCLAVWSGLERQVTIYWVTHVVNLEQHNSDEETKSWLPNLKRGSSRSKTAKPRDVRTDRQQIHVRSLFSLLVGTAVRDGSLYSAYSRTQTGRFEFSAWYPKRERRQQLKQSKRHYNGDWSNADMGSKNGKNNRLGLRSTWMHLDKESLNKAVLTMTVSPRAEYHCEDGGEQSYKSLYNYRATRSNREV